MNCALPATGANRGGGNEPMPPSPLMQAQPGMNAIAIGHNEIRQPEQRIAASPHIQRLENALDMRNFMAYASEMLSRPLSSDEGSADDAIAASSQTSGCKENGTKRRKRRTQKFGTKEERQGVKGQIFNFENLTADREWLYDVLMSDSSSDTEISDEDDYVKEMLRTHMREQKHRENFYKKPTNIQFTYYGSGLLSNHDMFPEHQQSIVGGRKRKRRTLKEKLPKPPKLPKGPRGRKPRNQMIEVREPGEIPPSELNKYTFGETSAINDDEDDDELTADDLEITGIDNGQPQDNATGIPGQSYSGRGRRRKSQSRTPAAMAARRRRIWQLMAKKELPRTHRARLKTHNDVTQNCKRIATMCMKVVRQRAMISQKIMKETVWRAKRLTREMLGYWKRYERVERDTRRRMEKEAEEQRKMDVEIIEAKRQQRKLNFLITQTELYAHFLSKKLGQGTEEEQLRILNQLDEEVNPRLANYDDYDADHMKLLAQKNAENAIDTDRAKTRQFDVVAQMKIAAAQQNTEIEQPIIKQEDLKADLPQPKIFEGTLKTYQIKGMTWLANLYDQGISGILADEMGLGKTVQSIAFLCHIAERYGVWGPFLIISPASTLHNWQQEMQRFVPAFNVVPYWGSPNERKILRQFWDQKDLHTREASFHVVITSYQLIVSDYKYINRIKWQYMVLDEAQAIKSSSSMRWKLLLGFNCRNRLLLSGTPIQNSMAELWALLHFIMPTLFDSHDEFNEWFSKDIESHAENKTGIDEKQISRLHMILKPFMLRRIKKDVENELSDKIEIMVYCPLTIRQKLLYMALKKKIRIEDLLHLTRGGGHSNSAADGGADRNFTSNLMNLVMQFRKVCNHPELFERRDVRSPFAMRCEEYVLPRLVYNEAMLYNSIPSKRHLLHNQFSIFKAEHIQRKLFCERQRKQDLRKRNELYSHYVDLNATNDHCFSFSRLCDLSPKDIEDITIGGLITLFLHHRKFVKFSRLLAYRRCWWSEHYSNKRFLLLEPMLEQPLDRSTMSDRSILHNFLFTGVTLHESSVYAFGDYTTVNMQETIEHRVIRSKSQKHLQALDENAEYSTTAIKSDLNIEMEEDELLIPLPVTTVIGKAHANHSEMKNKANVGMNLASKFEHIPRKPTCYVAEPLNMPKFLYGLTHSVHATQRRLYCESRAAEWSYIRHTQCENPVGLNIVTTGLNQCRPLYGWSTITKPDKQTLVSDAGKLAVLDSLLTRLKAQGHRVLIYSQMTKMIDLLEEYMWHRKHRYMRLDGSSKISARRDMVADFQSRADIFVFLLSTRAGGLGINLTAADTVIFYDSDWNPTVDQQAMDRAHRLGQTKQVTVYRLICKGTIEERILQRAREKSEIQRMVISGGNFKPDTLKPKEVVSLLLDDEEIETKYRQKVEPDPGSSQTIDAKSTDKRRRTTKEKPGAAQLDASTPNNNVGDHHIAKPISQYNSPNAKQPKIDNQTDDDSVDVTTAFSMTSNSSTVSGATVSTTLNVSGVTVANTQDEPFVPGARTVFDDSDNDNLIIDCESSIHGVESPTLYGDYGDIGRIRRRHHPRGTKRGRPRGSTRRGTGQTMRGRLPAPPGTPSSSFVVGKDHTLPTVANIPITPLTNTGGFGLTPLPVKRGPGRPRLKTAGPTFQGGRGSSTRARKHIGPLAVPIARSPAATPLNRSPAISPAPSPAFPREQQ